MSHKTHLSWMVVPLVAGAALFFSGAVGGGVLILLWPLVCVGMMVAMVWGMRGMSSGPLEHTHDDGVTHSHEVTPATRP